MLGIKNFDLELHRNIIENFFKLAQNGKTLPDDTLGHTDGWGIGYYRDGNAEVYKSKNSVLDEKGTFFEKVKLIKKTQILIVHFRKSAWKNTNSPENSHPFKKDNILFAHNGTVYDYKIIQEGRKSALDSEVYFEYIMKNFKNDLTEALKMAVDSIIKKKLKHSSLSCLLTDGNSLYAFREYVSFPEYYTLYETKLFDSYIVSSEAVSSELSWEPLRKNELFKV